MERAAAVGAALMLWICSVEALSEPRDVHFSSLDLRNLVRWTPAARSQADALYSVEYCVYGEGGDGGERWKRVERCTSITHTQCDVSEETADLREEYYARVRALSQSQRSGWAHSTRFSPLLDTVLGSPLVQLSVEQNFINISVSGPFRWQRRRSLWSVIPHMIYNLTVSSSGSTHRQRFLLDGGQLTLGPLGHSTRVCVLVQAQSRSLPLRSTVSPPSCAQTPADPLGRRLLTGLLGGVLPFALCLCALTVLAGLAHCYITQHTRPLPKSTVLCVSEKLHMLQPEVSPVLLVSVIGSMCSVEKQGGPTPQAPPLPHPPYAQQVLSAAGGGSDSGSGQSRHSKDEDYGVVLPALEVSGVREVSGVVAYTSQSCSAEAATPVEEEGQIFVDWSPETGQLRIPELLEQRCEEETQLLRDECEEEEDQFSRMERDWGLIIHTDLQ